MKKKKIIKSLKIGIIVLFIISSLSPIAIGYDWDKTNNEYFLNDHVYYYFSSSNLKQDQKFFQVNFNSDDFYESEKLLDPNKLVTISIHDSQDSPWPMLCYNNRHTGQSSFSTGGINELEKWRYRRGGLVDSSPVIDNNDIIYFTTTQSEIIALYPNGTLKWRYQTGGFMMSCSPVIAEDGTIYVGCWDDALYAINPNGTLKWKCGARGTIACSPAIAEDGTIYVGTMRGSDEGEIVAIKNDTLLWYFPTGYYITCSPSIGNDGTIYCGSGDTYFYALNPNGTLKWRFKTGDYIKGSASIADDGTIYIGSFDDYLYSLNPDNGTMIWKCKIGHGTQSNPSIAYDGTIYVGGSKLFAIYPNGTIKWSFNLGTNRHIEHSCPAISVDGTIYIGTNIGEISGGDIIAVNPNGTEKWRKKIAFDGWVDSSPAIGEDGTVYIGSAYEVGLGYLHAFGPVESNNPPNTPSISGKSEGKVGETYELQLKVIDPENNPISFFIDWGDGTEGWKRERASGEKCYYGYEWSEKGIYKIRVKAKDTLGEESDWAYLEIAMPYSHNPFWWLDDLLDRFPLLQRLLEMLI